MKLTAIIGKAQRKVNRTVEEEYLLPQSSHNFGKIPSNSPLLKGRTHHHPPLKKGRCEKIEKWVKNDLT